MRAFSIEVFNDDGSLNESLSIAFVPSNVTAPDAEGILPRLAFARSIIRQAEDWCGGILEVSREPRVREYLKEKKAKETT